MKKYRIALYWGWLGPFVMPVIDEKGEQGALSSSYFVCFLTPWIRTDL